MPASLDLLYYPPADRAVSQRMLTELEAGGIAYRQLTDEDLQMPASVLVGFCDLAEAQQGLAEQLAGPESQRFPEHLGQASEQDGQSRWGLAEQWGFILFLPQPNLSTVEQQSRIQGILDAQRQAGLNRYFLKALLTPYNQHWRFVDLARELEAEHRETLRVLLAEKAARKTEGEKQPGA